MTVPDLSISTLLQAYREGSATPREIIMDAWRRAGAEDPAIWISRPSEEKMLADITALDGESPDTKPLYGIPFAIKDNIDCEGLPTTAACPAWSYEPGQSAFVVDLLIKAGAVPVGKTNLDQFATGLVGVRSPYGVPDNAFHPDYIPGGSSSGSAVAVAKGLCSFALGTDTAGSGRVPASFNNLVGLKPTRGVLSAGGMVPACRTLDCVSIFALTASDAAKVFETAAVFDPADSWARPFTPAVVPPTKPRVGVPQPDQLEFFGNADAAQVFASALETARSLDWPIVEVDISPLLDAARLLYEGPWVAERASVISDLLANNPEALLPVTRRIIEGGLKGSAVDSFRAQYRLADLKRAAESVWRDIDTLLLPTAGTVYTKAEVEADPVRLNSNLGRYTNFMNLLDLCGCAAPAGFLPNGVPWGVTFYAQAHGDSIALDCAARFHAARDLPLGKTAVSSGSVAPPRPFPPAGPGMRIAVCGAHMEGLALHWQLRDRGARLVERGLSAPCYRLYLLPSSGAVPDRPGMARVSTDGAAVELEVWELPQASVGSFLAGVAAPLGLGRVRLADGREVCGFICEGIAAEGAKDITEFGGWRAWLASKG